MNTHTHTQGPWRVIEHGKGREKHCVGTANAAPIQAVICEINTQSVGTSDAIRLANARLIASAPELLAVLKGLVFHTSHFIHGDGKDGAIVENELRNAVFAIHKAEGNA